MLVPFSSASVMLIPAPSGSGAGTNPAPLSPPPPPPQALTMNVIATNCTKRFIFLIYPLIIVDLQIPFVCEAFF